MRHPHDDSGPADFRDEAVAASRAALADRRGVGPLEAGISLCVEAEDGGPEVLRRLRRLTQVRTVLGFGLLLAGVAAVVAHETGYVAENLPEDGLLFVGGGLSLLGLLAMLLGPWLQRRAVRRRLRDRPDAHAADGDLAPLYVEVEESTTFSRVKWMPEDLARVSFDREGRRLVIEGVAYRYVVHAQDVVSLRTVPSHALPGLEVIYLAAGARLGLTLTPDSVLSHLRRQTIGGTDALVRRVFETLGEGLKGKVPPA